MNTIERLTRVTPAGAEQGFSNVKMYQGSQILRVPEGSSVRNLTLGGGASYESKWASLRGGVLKFNSTRKETPVRFYGNPFVLNTAHTLMDRASLDHTIGMNPLSESFMREITGIAEEPLFLLPSSLCHPKELFLPQGTYTYTIFDPVTVFYSSHMELSNGVLSLEEDRIVDPAPFDILQGLEYEPAHILVKLMEGGFVSLFKYTAEQMLEMGKS